MFSDAGHISEEEFSSRILLHLLALTQLMSENDREVVGDTFLTVQININFIKEQIPWFPAKDSEGQKGSCMRS